MGTMHGEYDIDVNAAIIYINVRGAFNDIGAQVLAKELFGVIESFKGAPFSMLVNLLEFVGGTPEVFDESDEFNRWLNGKNLQAKALVFTSPTLIAIEKSRVQSKAEQNICYFENQVDALSWISEQTAALKFPTHLEPA
jgi:hypothetical protein